jgi:hypothetical protein
MPYIEFISPNPGKFLFIEKLSFGGIYMRIKSN